MGGGFAGISAGLEAAHASPTAVYRAPFRASHARFTVQPVIGRGARGLALTFLF